MDSQYEALKASIDTSSNAEKNNKILKAAKEAVDRGDLDKAEELLLKQHRREKEERRVHAATSYQLGELGYLKLEYEKALNYYEEAAQLAPQNSDYLNAAGKISHDLAKHDKAERYFEQALEIDQASFGKGHPKVARDLNNLATLLQATNRLKEAEPFMRRALEILETSLGSEHPYTKTARSNLDDLLKEKAE